MQESSFPFSTKDKRKYASIGFNTKCGYFLNRGPGSTDSAELLVTTSCRAASARAINSYLSSASLLLPACELIFYQRVLQIWYLKRKKGETCIS